MSEIVADVAWEFFAGDEPEVALRENQCVRLLPVLEAHNDEYWSVRTVASEALVPETTARRLLFPKVLELWPYHRLVSLRRSAQLSQKSSAAEYTTNLVRSYYGRVIANATLWGRSEGVDVYRVNTSQFELLQRVGAMYEYLVTFDSTMRAPRERSLGRARARFVGSGYRWSNEDKLDPDGYRIV